MTSNLSALPFFFREISSLQKTVISNQAGAFAFVESREQLTQLVNGDVSDLPNELIHELLAKNFLTQESEVAVRSRVLASHLATSISRAIEGPSLFMVVPTLRCDHNCRYCQVSRVPVDRKGYDLHRSRIEKILDVIESSSSKHVKIEFQGGEPLLEFEFLKDFVDRAEARLDNKDLSFVICSALGPLTDEMLAWASDHDIYFSVSLDGHHDLHVANRPSTYFDSYAQTMANLNKIRVAIGNDRVSCLATISRKSLEFPEKVVREYFDYDFPSIFLRPLSPFGFAARPKANLSYSPNEFMTFYRMALAEVLRLNSRRSFVEETAYIHLSRIFRPGQSGYVDLQSPSGYLLGAMVFNYDGRVFGSDEARMLWQTTKAPELVLGEVGKDSPMEILTNNNASALLSDSFLCAAPGCEECAFQPYCGADPLHHLGVQGDHVGDKSISMFCSLQRLMFDFLFETLESQPSQKEILMSWLNR